MGWFRKKNTNDITVYSNSNTEQQAQQDPGELAVENTVRDLTRVVDIPEMAEGAFGDRAVIGGFAKYKGLEYWEAISCHHPDVKDTVKEKLLQLYQELLEKGATDEKAQMEFKETYKGFSDAMEYAGTEMRANGWSYPWE